MKKFLKFVVRLSIINFAFFLLAIFFINQYKKNNVTPTTIKNIQQSQSEVVVTNNPVKVDVTSSPKEVTKKTQEPTPKAKDLFSELSSHNTRSSCWMIYQGNIYDITNFFGSHPGGDSIMLKYCGQDATTAFDSKDKSPAIPHSGSALSLLSQYLLQ